jgi:hypothetical protein
MIGTATPRGGRAAMAGRSERPVHSAEQPPDPKRYDRHSIGLGLDRPAQPLVEGRSGVARSICCLAVEVLGSARRLVELSPYLCSGVPCQATYAFLDFAADVSGCAGYAVFIHGSDPSHRGRCGLASHRSLSAMQRGPAGNVPATLHACLLFGA